jgi:hypothetical protein
MSNNNKAYFVLALIFMISLFSNCNVDGQGNKTKNIRFERIDHFSKITDSNEIMNQVYIVHNFPLDFKLFTKEVLKFLQRQPIEDYRTMYFILIQEHEKIELPLYEDTLNYRSKETSIEHILRSDYLGQASKFLNDENQIKYKISLSSKFDPKK